MIREFAKALIATATISSVVLPYAAKAEFNFTNRQTAVRLSKTAQKLKLPISFVTKKCGSNVQSTCTFSAGSLGGIAISDLDKNTKSITLIFANESKPIDVILAWGTLIAMLNPELTPDERGDLIQSLTDRLQSEDEEAEFRGEVRYKVTKSATVGVWLNADTAQE